MVGGVVGRLGGRVTVDRIRALVPATRSWKQRTPAVDGRDGAQATLAAVVLLSGGPVTAEHNFADTLAPGIEDGTGDEPR